MLLVPFLVGAIWRLQAHGSNGLQWLLLLSMLVAWMVGYFTFNAASLWLKARPARRHTFVRPLLVYASVSTVAILVALACEPQLGLWAPPYVLLTGATLWLVRRGDERATASGLLTTAAAALMAATVQFSTPADTSFDAWALAAVCFSYFFGTVLYVKTLIRERGKANWVLGSTIYHSALVLLYGLFAALTPTIAGARWDSTAWWVWCGFFVVTALRAGLVPLYGPMRGRRITPKQAGIGEAVLSLLLAILAIAL